MYTKSALNLILAPFVLAIVGYVAACNAFTKTVGTVLDVGDAACEALVNDGVGGGLVKVICKYIDQADKLEHTFIATMPKEQAIARGLIRPPVMSVSAPCASASSSK